MAEWSHAGTVETYTGRGFDPFDPDPTDVHLPDIAAGLAHTCRFGGHCRRFYSVAQHSIHVSDELPEDRPRLRLLGLLHDAGEAYVGDVPRPIKRRFEGFERVEAEILEAIWTGLGIEPPTEAEWERVMTADDRLLAYEAATILADGSWADPVPDLEYDLGAEPIPAVRRAFRSRAERLLEQV
jgi:hypothetical protein